MNKKGSFCVDKYVLPHELISNLCLTFADLFMEKEPNQLNKFKMSTKFCQGFTFEQYLDDTKCI
ncbi:hypothetical protein BpHYR1_007504 [Brachionus plicatilis]|uniref:Uncharacterized protein n=1 Tax=Brachionus plicatilis TaxID=10195 RepID=A0A3M7REQ2_BRAPC|nr:hypothetical protein BpHYR1_007504 [Brachionus plicatilis]